MFLTTFNFNDAQPQALDRFKQMLYQQLQVRVFLRTSKPESEGFPHPAPKSSRPQKTIFRVNSIVLANRNLCFGTIFEAYTLNKGSKCELRR